MDPPEADGTFVHDRRWIAALATAADPSSLLSLEIHSGGQNVGALLLVQEKGEGVAIRRLSTPLDGRIFLTDVAVPSRHRTAGLFEQTLESLSRLRAWDVLHFRCVRSRSHLIAMLADLSFKYSVTESGSSAYCDVSQPDALKAVSKENLRNVDRLLRRAERDFGDVEIDRISNEKVCRSAFDRFLEVENAGWKGAHGTGTSVALDQRAATFFRDVLDRFQHDGHARVDVLKIGGRDAAAHLAIRAGHTWFLLKIGFHPEFRAVGPGGILLKAFLEEMRGTPDVQEVNLTTNPPWAARWHFQTEPVHDVHIYGKTARGRVLHAGQIAKGLARGIRDGLVESKAGGEGG